MEQNTELRSRLNWSTNFHRGTKAIQCRKESLPTNDAGIAGYSYGKEKD